MTKLTQRINQMPMCKERYILRQLDYCWGEENAVSRQVLLQRLNVNPRLITIEDRELRRRIAALREDGWPICSKGGENGGYWLGDDDSVKEFRQREDRRAKTILVRDSKLEKGLYTNPERQGTLC